MAADMTTFQKYMFILETLNKKVDKTVTAYNEILIDKLQLSPKQIGRLLKNLETEFDNLILLEGEKKKTYKLVKPIDLFVEAFENSNEIGWLFSMAHDGDPEVFKELEQFTNTQKHIYKFKNTPFEDLSSLEGKLTFKRLKTAVELHEYRDIKFYNDNKIHKSLKCLKLVFMDNNWYIAYIDEENMLRFGRVSFIEEVNYTKDKNAYQPNSIKQHEEFIEEQLQNSMTLFDTPKQLATIKAHKPIAKYFDENMKKFLSSQTFVKKQSDGSVIFSLEYTQELEILPFIQKWLPDLEIIEPQSLRSAYKQKLLNAASIYS